MNCVLVRLQVAAGIAPDLVVVTHHQLNAAFVASLHFGYMVSNYQPMQTNFAKLLPLMRLMSTTTMKSSIYFAPNLISK